MERFFGKKCHDAMTQADRKVRWEYMGRIHTIQPGQIYRHFKNKLYQIVAVAEHTETGETLVIYQALYGAYGIYARPYEMFISLVDRSKYPEEAYPQEYRFEFVGQAGMLQAATQSQEERFNQEEERNEAWNLEQAQEDVAVEESVAAWSDRCAQSALESRKQKDRPKPQDYLLAFLETDSYQEKLDILRMLGDDCTETILNSMALSLDMALRGATLEDCMEEVRQCLTLHMKYEKARR